MELKDYLIKEINKRTEISSSFKERVKITTVDDSTEETDVAEIEIDQKTVIDYLNKSGYKLTQENYDLAEKMLKKMQGQELVRTIKNGALPSMIKYKNVDHLYDLSIEELQSLYNVAILNTLNEIAKKLPDPQNIRYDYRIEKVKDSGGATNITALSQVINRYSSLGYRVISVFTNELGVNSANIAGINLNSTADEVVVIFEKAIYLE